MSTRARRPDHAHPLPKRGDMYGRNTVNDDFTWTEAILAPLVLFVWAVLLIYVLPLMVAIE